MQFFILHSSFTIFSFVAFLVESFPMVYGLPNSGDVFQQKNSNTLSIDCLEKNCRRLYFLYPSQQRVDFPYFVSFSRTSPRCTACLPSVTFSYKIKRIRIQYRSTTCSNHVWLGELSEARILTAHCLQHMTKSTHTWCPFPVARS